MTKNGRSLDALSQLQWGWEYPEPAPELIKSKRNLRSKETRWAAAKTIKEIQRAVEYFTKAFLTAGHLLASARLAIVEVWGYSFDWLLRISWASLRLDQKFQQTCHLTVKDQRPDGAAAKTFMENSTSCRALYLSICGDDFMPSTTLLAKKFYELDRPALVVVENAPHKPGSLAFLEIS